MTPSEVFAVVSSEFSQDVALRVVAIHAVHMAVKPKASDLGTPGSFAARVEKRARKVLWAESQEDFADAFKVAMALYDYECRRSLQGLGGCTPASLQELTGLAGNATPSD